MLSKGDFRERVKILNYLTKLINTMGSVKGSPVLIFENFAISSHLFEIFSCFAGEKILRRILK